MFAPAISFLTASSIPWFIGLTFQAPMQYYSLQHWTSLSPPDTSTTECSFYFGPAASFFLELLVIALCSSPVAHWTPSNRRGSSSGLISSFLLILFFTAWDFTFTTRHIQNWASFLLWPSHFFLSGAVSSCPPLFPSLAYWMSSDLGVHLAVSYLFTFSYCLWCSPDKNTEVGWNFIP